MISDVTCDLCGNKCAYLLSKKDYTFYRCSDCGFIFVHPAPSQEVLKEYYQQNYYEMDDGRYQPSSHTVLNKWSKRLKTLDQHLAATDRSFHSKSILDLGCATGIFLQAARQQGWDIYGIEPSDYAAREAERRLGTGRIFKGSILDYHTDKKYSVISAWAVIEHINDPMLLLGKAHSYLEDDGILCLSTVNTDAINFALFNKNWRYLIPPEHLSYFNPKNMAMVAETNGFEILEMRTYYVYQAFLDGIIPQARHTTRRVSMLLKAPLYLLKVFSEFCGRGDTLEIWARKKANNSP